MFRLIALAVLTALALLLSRPIAAAEFCVSTPTDLITSLAFAGNNNQSDVIRIRAGNYDVPAGGFSFEITNALDDNQDLEISGGWFTFGTDPCAFRVDDPLQTTLDGNFADRILSIDLPENADVEIRNLTFGNGSSDEIVGGSGLRVYQDDGETFSGELIITNNVFINNTASRGAGLDIGLIEGTFSLNVQVLNNLFVTNQAEDFFGGAAQIHVDSPEPLQGVIGSFLPAVVVAHNTIVNNTAVSSDVGGIRLVGTIENVFVASNNIWGNTGRDLATLLNPDTYLFLRGNNIADIGSEVSPDVDVDNIGVAPVYEPCGLGCVDRVPVSGSPLIDAGYAPGAALPWTLPGIDLANGPRVRGTGVDIGAYEGVPDTVFSDRFEQ